MLRTVGLALITTIATIVAASSQTVSLASPTSNQALGPRTVGAALVACMDLTHFIGAGRDPLGCRPARG